MSTPPRRVTDADALPLLTAVMAAAGRHDAPECDRLLDETEATLPKGFHQSRADIDRAREAVATADWPLVWRAAWSATTGLTWAFPPDVSLCPPEPGVEPYGPADARTDVACAGCGHIEARPVRFCPMCGCAST